MNRDSNFSKPPRYITSGPLIIDWKRSYAMLDGERLPLNEQQVDALCVMVQQEGTYFTFEQLYGSAWDVEDADYRTLARRELDELVEAANTIGKGKVKLEHIPEKGYGFWALRP